MNFPTPAISSKLPDVGTNIFTVIGQLSSEYQAINLSQGAPNFPCDPALIELTHEAMLSGLNQYAPMAGVLSLRETLAEKVHTLYGQSFDPQDEITITASASEALYSAISALVHAGDEVIYFEPSFDSYAPIVRLQGATPVAIKLKQPDFHVDWAEVKSKITAKTKMIIVNTPHNPSASVFSKADLDSLAEVTRDTNIVVLSDEVYEHIVFDGAVHHSVVSHPELAARSVMVSSFGKSFHVTGWRIGYCLAPAAITAELRKVHQFMMFSADTPMQHALAAYMKTPSTYLSLGQLYQEKRDLLVNLLKDSPFELLPSHGSFFLLAKYGHFSQLSDSEFVLQLIKEHRVSAIPLSAFYTDGTDDRIIRFSFSKDEATLRKAAAALCQVGAAK
ncbi:methionine aminotransferase [Leeia sp. TBRC 13508]|uniref:Putative 8-amino-7-oxononanoate synthase n=1 Tax=Leeia speluncae TaxID=2884804 RepID=A0ABS8D773_9NEIS|nr:methionine aminotransferase [Leeia speluncae]MCB6184043.1 methionine aminotransferase [Leeia speluncae]